MQGSKPGCNTETAEGAQRTTEKARNKDLCTAREAQSFFVPCRTVARPHLFVIVQDSKGFMVAHGTNPGLIGKNVLDLNDVDGKPFNRETRAIKATGWVTFKWKNPLTDAIEPKTQYIIRTGDYLVGVGAYAK
jgi:signal transduction histidine kinase